MSGGKSSTCGHVPVGRGCTRDYPVRMRRRSDASRQSGPGVMGLRRAGDSHVGDKDGEDRLARPDACALADAVDQLEHAGVLDGVVSPGGPGRIRGRVVTVRLGRPASGAPVRHLCTAAVEASGPGQVLVVAHQGRMDFAGWDGNLSRSARQRGIAETIVDKADAMAVAIERGVPVSRLMSASYELMLRDIT